MKPRFSLVLYDRGFSGRVVDFDLRFEVEELSRKWLGGPKLAKAQAYGSLGELVRLAGSLRCPAEIWAEGRRVWWGYLAGVGIPALGIGASLGSLANRISVRMSNGLPYPWSDDLESQAVYGVRERIYMMPGDMDRAMWAYQQARLERQAWPGRMLTTELTTDYGHSSNAPDFTENRTEARPSPRGTAPQRSSGQPGRGQAGPLQPRGEGGLGANVALVGWWETLDWRYWECSPLHLEWEVGTIEEDFALSFGTKTRLAVRQLFEGVTQNCTLRQVKLRLCRVGQPADDLVVSVLDGSSGQVISSARVVGWTVSPGGLATVTATLPPTSMRRGEMIVQVQRTGEPSAEHYYQVGAVNWNGVYGMEELTPTGWQPYGTAKEDLAFELWGWPDVETTAQIKRVVEESGQFITRVQVEGASGVSVESYWSLDRALRRVEGMLELGTSTGGWMAAEVGPDRVLRVGPASTVELHIDGQGIWDGERELERWEVPAGRWVRATGAPGLWLDGELSGAGRAFVGETVYDARHDRVKLIPAGGFDEMAELAERIQGYLE